MRERLHSAVAVLTVSWIGSEPPVTTGIWRDHAVRHGWKYRLWDLGALEALGLGNDPVFRDRMDRSDLPGAVDVARYHVLRAEGGLYLDCDWLPVRDEPLHLAIPMTGLSAIAEDTPRLTGTGSPFLNNSVIAAPPGHPVFASLIDALPEVLRRLPKGPAWWNTGPLVFTLACRAGPVTILDAAFAAPAIDGDLAAAEAAVRALQDSPAVLLAWKPWEDAGT